MYISVQYLRAFSAILVLLTHVKFKLESNGYGFLVDFNIGHYGVDMFFIISGFIMCVTLDRGRRKNFKSFILNRFVRVLPIYWLLTFLTLIVFIIKPEVINSSGGDTHIISSFLLFPTTGNYLINNGWTLSYEMLFYFILGLFINNATSITRSVSFTLMSLVLIGFIAKFNNHILNFLTSPLLLEFVFGMIAYEIVKFKKINTSISLFLCLIFTVFIFRINLINIENSLERSLLVGLTMFIGFVGFVSLEGNIKDIKSLRLLGDSSYSLYLLHPFVLVVINKMFLYFDVLNNEILLIFCMVTSSVVCSILFYLLIEVRVTNYLKQKVKFYLNRGVYHEN